MHLTKTKFPTRYLVGRQALFPLSEIRNAISQKNEKTCANTDTRLGANVLFKEKLNRRIATDELGGVVVLKLSLNTRRRLKVWRVPIPIGFKTCGI